jgi:hypothetical protein
LPKEAKAEKKPKLKRKVSFAKQITSDQVQEKDPSEVLNLHAPKSILRNKDKKSPINEDLVQEMSQRDVKKIVPMNDQVKYDELLETFNTGLGMKKMKIRKKCQKKSNYRPKIRFSIQGN